MESFGSGSLEVGSDAMEQDLEELVRRSWADGVPQDGDAPPRSEPAAAARESWLTARSKDSEAEAEAENEEQLKQLAEALERTKKVKHPNSTIAKFLSGRISFAHSRGSIHSGPGQARMEAFRRHRWNCR